MERLAVSGFVLAGGLSSRMGTDKALLELCGRPMVEIAVEALREFCADVSVVGNRDDLGRFAPVEHEARLGAGPAAGVEAGLRVATQDWAVFVPVDVPLVPAELLQRWMQAVMLRACAASYLMVDGQKQPTFCALQRECLPVVSVALDEDERRLAEILRRVPQSGVGELWCCEAAEFAQGSYSVDEMQMLFLNINRPEDLERAERWMMGHTVAGE